MSSGDEQLVKLIGEGVGAGGQDAQGRSAKPPPALVPANGQAVEEQGENAVFGDMGQLACHRVAKEEDVWRQVNVKQAQRQGQHPLGGVGAKTLGRQQEDQPRPPKRHAPAKGL